jgi:hypothetical protein
VREKGRIIRNSQAHEFYKINLLSIIWQLKKLKRKLLKKQLKKAVKKAAKKSSKKRA